jgi:hypothetical protein
VHQREPHGIAEPLEFARQLAADAVPGADRAAEADGDIVDRRLDLERPGLQVGQGLPVVMREHQRVVHVAVAQRRGVPLPERSRLHATASFGPPVDDEHLYRVMDALEAVAEVTGRTVPQIALNWLLQRPTVASVILGARTEEQLRQNLGAVGWSLTAEQAARLEAASATTAPYPYFPYRRQDGFARLDPPIAG